MNVVVRSQSNLAVASGGNREGVDQDDRAAGHSHLTRGRGTARLGPLVDLDDRRLQIILFELRRPAGA